MGLYEQAIGNFFIPGIVVCLAILAGGTGRKKLAWLLCTILGVNIEVSGYKLKLIHLVILSNLVYVMVSLANIHRLDLIEQKEIENNHHVDHFAKQDHQVKIFIAYRNLLMNICSLVLILCLNVATSQYDLYQNTKELAAAE